MGRNYFCSTARAAPPVSIFSIAKAQDALLMVFEVKHFKYTLFALILPKRWS